MRAAFFVTALLLSNAGISVVFWYSLFVHPQGRQFGTFDLGSGCKVRIWSRGEPLEPHVPIYCQIIGNGVEGPPSPTSLLGNDADEPFRFKVAFAEGGKLACVYSHQPLDDRKRILIMYDVEQREAWMGRDCERAAHDNDADAWRDRYRKLRAANRKMPRFRHFEE